jgi:hypothetical protein
MKPIPIGIFHEAELPSSSVPKLMPMVWRAKSVFAPHAMSIGKLLTVGGENPESDEELVT